MHYWDITDITGPNYPHDASTSFNLRSNMSYAVMSVLALVGHDVNIVQTSAGWVVPLSIVLTVAPTVTNHDQCIV
jgi:hypothetical protein